MRISGESLGVLVVAVHVGGEAVAVGVLAGQISVVAVLVDVVAADLRGAGIDPRVRVVAVHLVAEEAVHLELEASYEIIPFRITSFINALSEHEASYIALFAAPHCGAAT